MQRRIVYLVTSGECGWADVRRALERLPGVSVREASSVCGACQGLNGRAPDLLLVSAGIACTLPAEQWEDCLPPRERPYRLAFIGTSPQFVDLPHHTHLEVAGHLLWPDLTAESLPTVLATLLETPLLLVSPEVARRFIVHPARETRT